jgi:hypothetical protein
MKAKTLLSALTLMVTSLGAQIPNTGFENLNTNGTVKNWGTALLTLVAIDSLGNAHTDSVVYDQALYFSTNDAHSGTKAVEMRNAFNYTGNFPIAGSINVLSNDSDYSSFGAPVSILQQPANFSFYYKFMPMANDTAIAMISLTDSSGTLMGEASIEITGQHNAYTLANMPITYYGTGQAFFAVISFSTAKAGTYPAFGTRFLVDDVNTIITGLENRSGNKAMSCFPNPARDHVVIVPPGIKAGERITLTTTDMNGKIIELKKDLVFEKELLINTSALTKGCYVLTVTAGEKQYHAQFIKEN